MCILIEGSERTVYESDIFRHFSFVILGDAPYQGPSVSPSNIIAQRISMNYNVYYVEPPTSILSALKPGRNKHKVSSSKNGVTEAEYNLKVVSPPPIFLPMEARIRTIDTINQLRFGRYLKDLLEDEQVQNFILWSFRYNSQVVFHSLRPDVAIYQAMGRRSEDTLPMADKNVVDEIEQLTLRTADLAFTSSDMLYRHLSRIKEDTYYMPPGVDYKLFHTALRSDLRIPVELSTIPEPRVAYVGILEHWVDIQLLEYLVSHMPDISFVFIGRYGPWLQVDRLLRFPNVHFLGGKPRANLPSYLRHMNACIIPFKINELTLHAHPMKIYEYLAAGKPIVSTPIHEVEKFSEFLEIAFSPQDFAIKLRQAISDKDINRANARAQIARHYSWTQRIQEMLNTISNYLVGAEERPFAHKSKKRSQKQPSA